jgi:hypothetical protein
MITDTDTDTRTRYARLLVPVTAVAEALDAYCGGCADDALADAATLTTEDDYREAGLVRFAALGEALALLTLEGCDECRTRARLALATG